MRTSGFIPADIVSGMMNINEYKVERCTLVLNVFADRSTCVTVGLLNAYSVIDCKAPALNCTLRGQL